MRKRITPRKFKMVAEDGETNAAILEEVAIFNKLGQLEDIEDELGIDLATLFKALTDGIWYEKEGHSLHTDLCLNVDKEWVISCWLKKYECIYCRLKDYGKTWALTREELL